MISVGIDPGGTSGSICFIFEQEGRPDVIEFFYFSTKEGYKCPKTGKRKYRKILSTPSQIRDFVNRIARFKSIAKCSIKIILEEVNAMPTFRKNAQGETESTNMGSTSAFEFGGNYRSIIQCIADHYMEDFLETKRPAHWQKEMDLKKTHKGMTKTEHKQLRRAFITPLYPQVKVLNDNIDSLILAHMARTKNQ